MKTLARIAWMNIKIAWYHVDDFVACLGSLERNESLSSRWTQVEWERNRIKLANQELTSLRRAI